MKRHQIALGLLFIALPFFVIAFLTQGVDQSTESPSGPSGPVSTSPCSGKSRDVLIKEYHDLPYYNGPGADSLAHSLNLFIPASIENAPLMLWIHGGAWAFGNKSKETPLARKFAEAGIAVAVVGYRLSPATWGGHNKPTGVRHPAHIEDIARSFRWLYQNAGDYGYDRHSIFVSGYSAGGHLSALLTTNPEFLEDVGRSVRDIRGAVPIAGAYDIESYYRSHLQFNGKEMADGHVKAVFVNSMGELRDASPTTYFDNMWTPMLVVSEKNTFGYTKLLEEAAAQKSNNKLEFLHTDNLDHKGLYECLALEEECSYRDRIGTL